MAGDYMGTAIRKEKPTAFARAKNICRRLAVPTLIAGVSYGYYRATGADLGGVALASLLGSFYFFNIARKIKGNNSKQYRYLFCSLASVILAVGVFVKGLSEFSTRRDITTKEKICEVLTGTKMSNKEVPYFDRIYGSLSSDVGALKEEKRMSNDRGEEFVLIRVKGEDMPMAFTSTKRPDGSFVWRKLGRKKETYCP